MATPRLIALLAILMSLTGVVYGQGWRHSGYENTTFFNSTMWVPDPATNCAGAGIVLLTSPDKNYSLWHVTQCQDQTPQCWVGVDFRRKDIFTLTSFNWLIPPANFTLNQACTLQFTSDGDLRLVIFDLDEPGINGSITVPRRVTWSSNTTGEGAVQVQLQNTGNLILVNKDGKSAVWTSLRVPLLPLAPLNGTSTSSSSAVSMPPAFSLSFSFRPEGVEYLKHLELVSFSVSSLLRA
ncbi:hypothetical protein R1sor_001998 [Riccia sorocarpa]|uniref:Bulb-type lectin domain-containing protein n=1 Tax=Riccia sorocarpa TaxID=122646 RepID=A0ABD3GZ65_9MARC